MCGDLVKRVDAGLQQISIMWLKILVTMIWVIHIGLMKNLFVKVILEWPIVSFIMIMEELGREFLNTVEELFLSVVAKMYIQVNNISHRQT